jgi:hypothetical protein
MPDTAQRNAIKNGRDPPIARAALFDEGCVRQVLESDDRRLSERTTGVATAPLLHESVAHGPADEHRQLRTEGPGCRFGTPRKGVGLAGASGDAEEDVGLKADSVGQTE